jgi:hypothetical protein
VQYAVGSFGPLPFHDMMMLLLARQLKRNYLPFIREFLDLEDLGNEPPTKEDTVFQGKKERKVGYLICRKY